MKPVAATPARPAFAAHPSPWWRALASQAAGLLAAILAGMLWPLVFGAAIPTPSWTLVQSACAGATAAALGLAWWWIVLSLAFVPALAIGVAGALPPQWSAAILIALVLVYGGAQRTRVPLYLSNLAAVRALRNLVPMDRPLSFLDVGSGIGTVLAAIASSHSNVAVQGVERAPIPFFLAFLRAVLGRHRYRVRWGNLWSTDLSGHDVVYAYLSPVPMPLLWEKARREMRPGSLLVSFCFAVPGVVPWKTVAAGGNWLYVWRLP